MNTTIKVLGKINLNTAISKIINQLKRKLDQRAKRKNKIKRESKNSNQNGKEARLSEVKEDN